MIANKEAPEVQIANAALIVTLYGPSALESDQRLEAIMTRMVSRLSLEATSSIDQWRDLTPDHEIFLQRFEPPAAQDTTVLQLALNEPGPASKAWDVLRYRLESILDESCFKYLWGYSLIYQAELSGVEVRNFELKAGDLLLQAARRLDLPTSGMNWVEPLAITNFPNGTLWLIDIPKDDDVAAATVYLALNNAGSGNQLISEHLYGPGARLLMPDLIAHKGYFQSRQYQVGNFQKQYSQKISAVHASTHHQLHQIEENKERAIQVELLARDYGYLIDALSYLEQLRVALARQLHNYDWWHRNSGNDDVLNYHRKFLENCLLEIKLLIDEGNGAIRAAGTAVEMIQARLDNRRQRQQETLNTILAILAVALALPQILDREVVNAILVKIGIHLGTNPGSTVWLFGIQAFVILLVMGIAAFLVHFIENINGKEGDKRKDYHPKIDQQEP